MSDTRYTKDHEFIRIEGDSAVIGITAYAQEQLGDVVFVELPEIGASFSSGEEAAVVESVKAASEVNAPISGDVLEINGDLEGEPGLVNEDPVGRGWFIRLSIADKSELDNLIDEAAYQAFVAEL